MFCIVHVGQWCVVGGWVVVVVVVVVLKLHYRIRGGKR